MDKYLDPSASAESRARDLLQRLTLAEKIGQLNQPLYGWKAFRRDGNQIELTAEFTVAFDRLQFGAMYGLLRADPWSKMNWENGLTPALGPGAANLIQRYALAHSRHGIPLFFSEECPHGHMALGATVLPIGIAQASTWNEELLFQVGAVGAAEARAAGAHIGYGPVLDLAREPRWGRTEEQLGEDPFLAGVLGAAIVRGMQGESLGSAGKVIATLKHFAAYGAPQGGHNAGASHVGPRELREIYLPAFEAAVRAGAGSVMAAYNEVDGVPCHANPELLRKILRGQWGFQGFVVSDGCGIDSLSMHRTSSTPAGRAAAALNAGVNLSLWDEAFQHLQEAVDRGLVSVETINQAAFEILRAKFQFGLFEHPLVDEGGALEIVGCPGHRTVALEIAREAVTLLENRGGILPLAPDKLRSISVVGPNADNLYNQLGDYVAPQSPHRGSTVLAGIRAAVGPQCQVRYARGCRIKDLSQAGFPEAVAAAENSEVAVVVVGGSSARDFEGLTNAAGQAVVSLGDVRSDMDCGEGYDHHSLELCGAQMALLQALKATGKPLIVVLIHGRPYCLGWMAKNAAAVLSAWYPGQEGGQAIAEVIFGLVNPSGRLPISMPKHVGQLPVCYNHKAAGQSDYVLLDGKPQYSFGYGLSYTKFSYSGLKLSRPVMRAGESCEVRATVANIGPRAGKEVVQLYVRDEECTFARPVWELKGFKKVHLEAGAAVEVSFIVGRNELAYPAADLDPWVEPGEFTLRIGGGMEPWLSAGLTVRMS